MEKYVEAIESTIRLMVYWMRDYKDTPSNSYRIFSQKIRGVIEVAIYDTDLSSEDFERLQIFCRDEKIIERLEDVYNAQ